MFFMEDDAKYGGTPQNLFDAIARWIGPSPGAMGCPGPPQERPGVGAYSKQGHDPPEAGWLKRAPPPHNPYNLLGIK
jgi:hypothetical protein